MRKFLAGLLLGFIGLELLNAIGGTLEQKLNDHKVKIACKTAKRELEITQLQKELQESDEGNVVGFSGPIIMSEEEEEDELD